MTLQMLEKPNFENKVEFLLHTRRNARKTKLNVKSTDKNTWLDITLAQDFIVWNLVYVVNRTHGSLGESIYIHNTEN